MAPLSQDATEEARALATAWLNAAMASDDDWFYANAAEEFRYQMGNGDIAALDVIVPFAHQITDKHYEVLEVTGHRYGHVVVGYGVYLARGTFPAGFAPDEYVARYAEGMKVRFSQIWVEDASGTPKIVLNQGTNIP